MIGFTFRASYLIRFDDVSPYMNWEVWEQIESILDKLNIKPIVAIVPDCRDESIMVDAYNDNFWERVREWESKGWGIALHGYQHKFTTFDSGIVGLNNYSEFSGLASADQEYKISQGLKIFKENDCKEPHIWVAPAHSFDSKTIDILVKYNVNYISDSFALYPYKYKSVFWIPQQLWQFRRLPIGLWTICLHHNKWGAEELKLFEEKVVLFQDNITDIESVARLFKTRELSFFDKFFSMLFARFVLLKKWFKGALLK